MAVKSVECDQVWKVGFCITQVRKQLQAGTLTRMKSSFGSNIHSPSGQKAKNAIPRADLGFFAAHTFKKEIWIDIQNGLDQATERSNHSITWKHGFKHCNLSATHIVCMTITLRMWAGMQMMNNLSRNKECGKKADSR